MKQEKKLQRWMKILISKKGLNPYNYYYTENEPGKLTIIHKHSIKEIEIEY